MKILYFASLKETLGKESETLSGFTTLGALKTHLEKKYGTFDANTLIAINLVMTTNMSQVLSEEDEIAFYPPVTGG